MKHIRVTFSNGETYEIQALKIANSRGKYYADKEHGVQDKEVTPDPQWTAIYRKERDVALKNDEELIDWSENNTNWEDIEQFAVLVPSDSDKELNKHEEWMNNDKTIIEHN
jgi:hypothetical protein